MLTRSFSSRAARHIANSGGLLQYVRSHAAAAKPRVAEQPLPVNTQAASPKGNQAASPLEAELDPRKAPQIKMQPTRSASTQNLMKSKEDSFQWEDSTHPRQRRAERDHFKASLGKPGSKDGKPVPVDRKQVDEKHFRMHGTTPTLMGGASSVRDTGHFRTHAAGGELQKDAADTNYMLGHPIWTEEEKHSVEVQHRKCVALTDYLAYGSVQLLRFNFDLFSGYFFGQMDESKWLTRIVFLETVAGVPGMVGAMIRHLHSLRLMRRDYGWIHTLLEEAENERMHLLTAMKLKKPTRLFRASVLVSQGIFVNLWFVAYLASPRFCHRFVGYLEEEAVVTYTKCLKELDADKLPLFSKLEAPPIAKKYWRLPEDAKMRDVLLSIRADESHHRDVNHALAGRNPLDPNPFGAGK